MYGRGKKLSKPKIQKRNLYILKNKKKKKEIKDIILKDIGTLFEIEEEKKKKKIREKKKLIID